MRTVSVLAVHMSLIVLMIAATDLLAQFDLLEMKYGIGYALAMLFNLFGMASALYHDGEKRQT